MTVSTDEMPPIDWGDEPPWEAPPEEAALPDVVHGDDDEPLTRAAAPVRPQWALVIVEPGVGNHYVTCAADWVFRVTVGRTDNDQQPSASSGTFTLEADGADRMPWLTVNARIQLRVTVAGPPLVVWNLRVADIQRRYRVGADGKGHNTITITGVGPKAALGRRHAGHRTPYGWETDGDRVERILKEVGASQAHWRNHLIVSDVDGVAWTPASPHTYSASSVTFTRSTVSAASVLDANLLSHLVPSVVGELDIQSSTAAVAEVWLEPVFQPGVSPVTVFGNKQSFRLGVGVNRINITVPIVDEYANAFLTGPGGTGTISGFIPKVRINRMTAEAMLPWQNEADKPQPWSTWSPAGETWLGTKTGTDTASIRTARFYWRRQWDRGVVAMAARRKDDSATATALQLADDTADAAYGVFWEGRDLDYAYTSYRARRGALPVHLTIDACHLLADSETSMGISSNDLINELTVTYGDPPDEGERASIGPHNYGPAINKASQDAYGIFAETMPRGGNAYLRDAGAAQGLIDHLMATRAHPTERLSELTTQPLGELPNTVLIDLFTVPLGALIEVTGAHTGWVGTSWQGFLEGWELTASTGYTSQLTLRVSPRVESNLPALRGIDPEDEETTP